MTTPPSKTQHLIVSVGALTTLCFSMVALTGWLTGDVRLAQLHPDWTPMQFNAALCFALTAGALQLEFRASRFLPTVFGSLVLLIGLLTMLEYLLVFNAGIDELFMSSQDLHNTSHPGRMAPGTAFCFTILGAYLLYCSRPHQHGSRLVRLFTGAIVASFGVIALTGYVFKIEAAYGWEEYTRMAAPTAFCFAVLGATLLLSRWSTDRAYKAVILITLVGTVLSLSALHLNRAAEVAAFRARLQLDASLPVWLLQKDVSLALRYLRSIAAFIESSAEVTDEEFTGYIDKIAGDVLSAVHYEWIPIVKVSEREAFEAALASESGEAGGILEPAPDDTLRRAGQREVYYPVRYLTPQPSRYARRGMDRGSEPEYLATIEQALRGAIPVISTPISSIANGRSARHNIYFAAQPVRQDTNGGPHKGLVTAIVDTQSFADNALSQMPDIGIDLYVYDTTSDPDGVLIARHISRGHRGIVEERRYRLRSDRLPSIALVQEVTLSGRRYAVLGIPTERYMLQFTVLPWVAMTVSFLMTLSTAFFVYWLTDQSDRLRRTKRFLEIQTGVGRILNEDKSLEDIAQGVLSILCRNSPWSVGGFWLVGPSGLLHCSAFYSRPGEDCAAFEAASLSPDCRHDQSLIGRVWRSRQHEWIQDLRLTPDSLRREAALASGLASGIGFPIHIKQRVVGVIDLYSRTTQAPDLELLHVLAAAGATIGQYLLRREAQMRLESQHEDLERVYLELDSFVYTASHDLRAPLRAIGSFSDFLEEDYGAKLDEQGRDYLAEIKKGVRRMAALIDDLLTLSRLSRIHNPYESVPMGTLAREICDRLGFDIDSTGAEIVIREDLPTIRCDRIKMGELLVNLIGNAVKYSSKLADRKARIEIGYQDRPAEYVFYVRDNGIGIEPKYQEQIFTMFKRLHTQEEYEGTGAGLNIVKRIIEEHRGKVWVSSEPGKGSTFFFSVPKAIGDPIRTEKTP